MWEKTKQQIHSFLLSVLRSEHYIPVMALFFTWGVLFSFLFINSLQVRETGVWAGHENLWSDWSLHIAIANIFALKDPVNWFAHHPHFAYGKFTYGFMTNFISGMLMRFGVNLIDAFVIPSLVYTFVLLGALYSTAYALVRHRYWAVLAVTIFFLSGGFGFWHVAQDAVSFTMSGDFWNPPHNFSYFPEYDWYAGNTIVGLLYPQRAFFLGMTVAMSSLAITLHNLLVPVRKKTHWYGLAAGLLAGVLPITHMHSFMALIFITGPVSLWKLRSHWRYVLPYASIAGIVSTGLFLRFIAGGIESDSFFSIVVGWSADTWSQWYVMWSTLWGVMLAVAAVGLAAVWRMKDWDRAVIFTSFISIFILANIVVFQPIRWDNSKLFIWAYFGMSCLAVIVLRILWARQNFRVLQRGVVVLLFIALVINGLLDMQFLVKFDQHSHQMTSNEDIRLNQQVQLFTDENAVFATNPAHNHPVSMWAARPIMMGYSAWVMNFGFEYADRESALRAIFSGASTAIDEIEKYQISYVYFGPGERYMVSEPDEAFYSSRFPVAFENNSTRIYDVRSVWQEDTPSMINAPSVTVEVE